MSTPNFSAVVDAVEREIQQCSAAGRARASLVARAALLAAEHYGGLDAVRPVVPRRFVLQRDQDPTGRSGTGQVAEGVEFTDGWVAVRWTGCERVCTVLWPSIADVEAINGHEGATRVVWLDEVTT